LCFNYQTGECHGACEGVEPAKKYNKRVAKAIEAFRQPGNSAAIIGTGRSRDEQSLVLVDRGCFCGFGYFGKDEAITDFESARRFVKTGIETPTVQNLINSYLTNPRGTAVMLF
jgi:DNA polymerase-3 subunit epsilon